jgi:hypothetical protein
MAKRRAEGPEDEREPGARSTDEAPVPLLEPDPDDSSAAPGGDQDIDTAGTDANPLTRPQDAAARNRRSSPVH